MMNEDDDHLVYLAGGREDWADDGGDYHQGDPNEFSASDDDSDGMELGEDPISWTNLLNVGHGRGPGGGITMGRSTSTSARHREQERVQRAAMLRAGAPGKDDGTGFILGQKEGSEEKILPP